MEPDLPIVVLLGGMDFGGTMSKADEYYARAAQCKIRAAETKIRAAETTDPVFKHEFEQLAQKWTDLVIGEEINGYRLLNGESAPTAAGNDGGVG
jgi:hypothetical protein